MRLSQTISESADCLEEVSFEASENLYNSFKSQVLVFKGTSKALRIYAPRSFHSLCSEFSGSTGISLLSLRFRTNSRDVRPDTLISSGCIVQVSHRAEFLLGPANSLRRTLAGLIDNPTFSDFELVFGDQSFKLHKALLVARCELFAKLFEKEGTKDFNPDEIAKACSSSLDNQYFDVQILSANEGIISKAKFSFSSAKNQSAFKALLRFLYTGDVSFEDDAEAEIELMIMADKFGVPDFKQICEDDLLRKLNVDNILELLIKIHESKISTHFLMEKVKGLFFKNFQRINESVENLEEIISSHSGLMTLLFESVTSKKKSSTRRVTFLDSEEI